MRLSVWLNGAQVWRFIIFQFFVAHKDTHSDVMTPPHNPTEAYFKLS